MAFSIRIEEYTPLGDIILSNFTRDFAAINARYPKLNEVFKTNFTNKLEAITQTQESNAILNQKNDL